MFLKASFNPRARVGRDQLYHWLNNGGTGFNPRARVGRDETDPRGLTQVSVSIHAPAWGATDTPVTVPVPAFSFNPRARVGRDSRAPPLQVWIVWFQSTRPRGARPTISSSVSSARGVSIHAPAWGATGNLSSRCRPLLPFQSTRPRGARPPASTTGGKLVNSFNPRARVGRDHLLPPCWRVFRSFNPRARVGRDATFVGNFITTRKFQSTRPRGARLNRPPCNVQIYQVSIHAPAWGAT